MDHNDNNNNGGGGGGTTVDPHQPAATAMATEVLLAPGQHPFSAFSPVHSGSKDALPAGTASSSSLVHLVTRDILSLFRRCNPEFRYMPSSNPRRVLTKPSQGVDNYNYDNVNADLILYVGDVLGLPERKRYLVLDLLGQGTFGQVVKCKKLDTGDIVAIKVVRNRLAYTNQGKFELQILELLNSNYDPDTFNMVEMIDHFVDRNHLCLVFELLSLNLFEVLKQKRYLGLSTNLIRIFLKQILKSLEALNECGLVHCDLKPENILLRNQTGSPEIKVIDFGSACWEHETIYTYIQSRFYRSPEVILGCRYTSKIDMWSLGCLVAELFLGLPLFPGHNEHNQLARIIEMLGDPPEALLSEGKFVDKFYNKYPREDGTFAYQFKSEEQYAQEQNISVQQSKRYFPSNDLHQIIQGYRFKKNLSPEAREEERTKRESFTDLIKGMLRLDPEDRWSPQQASFHPFMLGEPYGGPFVPPPMPKKSIPAVLEHQQQQAVPTGFMPLGTNLLAFTNGPVAAAAGGGHPPHFPASFPPPGTDLGAFSRGRGRGVRGGRGRGGQLASNVSGPGMTPTRAAGLPTSVSDLSPAQQNYLRMMAAASQAYTHINASTSVGASRGRVAAGGTGIGSLRTQQQRLHYQHHHPHHHHNAHHQHHASPHRSTHRAAATLTSSGGVATYRGPPPPQPTLTVSSMVAPSTGEGGSPPSSAAVRKLKARARSYSMNAPTSPPHSPPKAQRGRQHLGPPGFPAVGSAQRGGGQTRSHHQHQHHPHHQQYQQRGTATSGVVPSLDPGSGGQYSPARVKKEASVNTRRGTGNSGQSSSSAYSPPSSSSLASSISSSSSSASASSPPSSTLTSPRRSGNGAPLIQAARRQMRRSSAHSRKDGRNKSHSHEVVRSPSTSHKKNQPGGNSRASWNNQRRQKQPPHQPANKRDSSPESSSPTPPSSPSAFSPCDSPSTCLSPQQSPRSSADATHTSAAPSTDAIGSSPPSSLLVRALNHHQAYHDQPSIQGEADQAPASGGESLSQTAFQKAHAQHQHHSQQQKQASPRRRKPKLLSAEHREAHSSPFTNNNEEKKASPSPEPEMEGSMPLPEDWDPFFTEEDLLYPEGDTSYRQSTKDNSQFRKRKQKTNNLNNRRSQQTSPAAEDSVSVLAGQLENHNLSDQGLSEGQRSQPISIRRDDRHSTAARHHKGSGDAYSSSSSFSSSSSQTRGRRHTFTSSSANAGPADLLPWGQSIGTLPPFSPTVGSGGHHPMSTNHHSNLHPPPDQFPSVIPATTPTMPSAMASITTAAAATPSTSSTAFPDAFLPSPPSASASYATGFMGQHSMLSLPSSSLDHNASIFGFSPSFPSTLYAHDSFHRHPPSPTSQQQPIPPVSSVLPPLSSLKQQQSPRRHQQPPSGGE
ncbi:dual specificity protein kinase yak1 [Balamuthia mandrillaris]